MRPRLPRLMRQDDGSASVLPMLVLTALLVVGGFSIDTANLWRNGEAMRATADAAAHAGAVALARGMDPADARVVAETAIGLNLDPALFAAGPDKPASQLVRLWHYDAATGQLSEDGAPNAVSVQLRRSGADGNAVKLRLLDLFGLDDVTTSTTSVVALAPTARCANTAGLFARDGLALEGGAEIGPGFCLHSQREITLARQVTFAEGAHLSQPDLARCEGMCDDDLSPGLAAAASEMNLIGTPLRDRIGATVQAMLAPLASSPEKADFFATRPLDDDLEPLAELGLDVSNLTTGAVMRLSRWDLEVIRALPRGLVYAVTCDPADPEPPVLSVGGGVNAPAIRDVVILTDCALHFPDDIEVTGALILSTYDGPMPSITADPYALLGDPSVFCDPAAQSQVMALGDQVLPPGLVMSNVAMVLDGNVTLLPGEGGLPAQHNGFALHAGGRVTVQGQHSFAACEQTRLATLPALDVLRFVMPKVPAQPILRQETPDMPGERVQPLPPTPPLPMSKEPPAPEQLMSEADLPREEVGL